MCIMLILLASCSPKNGIMIAKDKDGSKMLVGIADKSKLMDDKAFGWFKDGYTQYKPHAAAIKTIRMQASSLRIVVFGGTWCSDTHDLLPGFYKAMDDAGIKDSQIKLYLVNRDKKTKDGASDKYQITNVPTIIVFKGDVQLGKVVEIAKTNIEGDIAAMLVDKD
jgi:Thioredoxin